MRLTACAPQHWPVAPGWRATVDGFFASGAGQALAGRIGQRLAAGATVYPPEPLRALALTPPESVRVVILGQDPYHGAGQAEGLAFSVQPGVRVPPSLRNIHAELQRDLGIAPPPHGSLAAWARQGVLLLNTCLTVEDASPASHAKFGWEVLTDLLIDQVAGQGGPCVFLLWGAHAQAKAQRIEAVRAVQPARHAEHLVLQANHPSPLSARRPPVPFIGCGHFGRAQRWLAERGAAVDFALPRDVPPQPAGR
ncbi:MAG: uracil-DNA glycosylase [Burkholderiaceae bacterium]